MVYYFWNPPFEHITTRQVVATIGTYDITMELGKKVHIQLSVHSTLSLDRNCRTCNGWNALQCTMCKGSGKVHYQVKNYTLKRGEKATAEGISDAITENRAELVHLPSTLDLHVLLPSKECPSCDGSYDQLRDVVAERKPGWEYLQEALISIDPACARDDPVIVKNVPYYKAKKALEAEVMSLDLPPQPQKWGELDLPLTASSWSEEDRKDPKKLYEMTILDSQWERKWREEKFSDIKSFKCPLKEMLQEKVQPYIRNMENMVLPSPIVMPSHSQDQKELILTIFHFSLAVEKAPAMDFLLNQSRGYEVFQIKCTVRF
ncbi:hypothetical protein M9H77_21865 [Catharanthus roseus]|uniref:Uncharacterized protein n=1 Tax=Catharanthus roseus TaxID=4058 RepID=A0ACC0AQ16_CATRO|nr:hypothetical protein M9H77_21865 [Catharanthus roseus]